MNFISKVQTLKKIKLKNATIPYFWYFSVLKYKNNKVTNLNWFEIDNPGVIKLFKKLNNKKNRW